MEEPEHQSKLFTSSLHINLMITDARMLWTMVPLNLKHQLVWHWQIAFSVQSVVTYMHVSDVELLAILPI